jgi:hypothetical protein
MNKMKSKSKSTNGAVVSDEDIPGIIVTPFSEDISESKVIDERVKINGHRIRKGKNIVRLYSRNISIDDLTKNKPAILYLNNGAMMSGKIRGSKYNSEDELEVLFVDNNKKAEAEKKNKWLEDQVNDQDNNGMSSYGRLEVYENKLAAKPEKLILTRKKENDAGVDTILTEDGGLRAVVKDMANDVKTADRLDDAIETDLRELSDGYEIQRIPGVPAVNTKVLVLNDVMVDVRPMADGMDGVIITVKESNQIIQGLKNARTRFLNGIERLSGDRVKINNKRKRIRQQNFVIQDNKTPKEIELEEAIDILNEKQDKDYLIEIQDLGKFIIACDVDGREIKGTLRVLRDGSSNGEYRLEAKLENAERLQNALAKVKIFLEEEPRNQKVKKMVNRKR